MRAIKSALAALALVASLLVPALPALAAGTQISVVSPTNAEGLTNGYLKLKIQFSGGVADHARNCVDLGATYGQTLHLLFAAGSTTVEALGSEFYFSEVAVSPTALTCELTRYMDVYRFDQATESVPLRLSIRTDDGGQSALSTVLYNPAFKGQVGITSPVRGQTVSSTLHIDYSIVPGANRTPDSVWIAICRTSCDEDAPRFIDVLTLDTNNYGVSGAGIVLAGGTYGADVAFTSTGLAEISLRASFGSVDNTSSVMVNVTNDIYTSAISWDTVLKLGKVSEVTLTPTIDCGAGYFIPGGKLSCNLTVDTGTLRTEVPLLVWGSSNGNQAVALGSATVASGKRISFQVNIPKTASSYRIIVSPVGVPSIVIDKTYGPPPPRFVSVVLPSNVRSHRPFKVSLTLSKKVGATCEVAIKDVGTIGSARIKDGKGSGLATIRLSTTAPKSIKTPLVIRCTDLSGAWSISNNKTITTTK